MGNQVNPYEPAANLAIELMHAPNIQDSRDIVRFIEKSRGMKNGSLVKLSEEKKGSSEIASLRAAAMYAIRFRFKEPLSEVGYWVGLTANKSIMRGIELIQDEINKKGGEQRTVRFDNHSTAIIRPYRATDSTGLAEIAKDYKLPGQNLFADPQALAAKAQYDPTSLMIVEHVGKPVAAAAYNFDPGLTVMIQPIIAQAYQHRGLEKEINGEMMRRVKARGTRNVAFLVELVS